jgi:hypothetical protein
MKVISKNMTMNMIMIRKSFLHILFMHIYFNKNKFYQKN